MALSPRTAGDELRLTEIEEHRRELTGYCYRMLGSALRGRRRGAGDHGARLAAPSTGFEGRSTLRSWLYRIATNVCLDMLRGRQRRARPMDLGPAVDRATRSPASHVPESTWIAADPRRRVVPDDADPAELAVDARDDPARVRHRAAAPPGPPARRAHPPRGAALAGDRGRRAARHDASRRSTAPLQRARATLADAPSSTRLGRVGALDADQEALLARYVDAFERYDITSLVALLHEDAIMSMPPYDFWLAGPEEIGRWFLGEGIGCEGSRLVATTANGCAAFGSYHVDPAGGHSPWAVQVLEISGDRIVGHHNFLDTNLFTAFGLPPRL